MIQLVTAQELTDIDLQWIAKVCEESYDDLDAKTVVHGLITGQMLGFRLTDPVEGFLLVTKSMRTGKKELFINGFAGRGIISKIFAIVRELKAWTKANGGEIITGLPHKPGLYKVYETLGAKPVAMLYALEVNDGN